MFLMIRTPATQLVVLLLITIHNTSILGIQVYEDNDNDTTTVPPTMLAPIPTTSETPTSSIPMEMSSTTAESRVIMVHSTTENSVIPMVKPTKSSRIQSSMKPKKESLRQDQQQRSTSTVTNKNFVPSQQISAVVTPLASSADYTRDNVVPLNSFQKTTNTYDQQPFLPYPNFATQSPNQPAPRIPFDNNNYLPNFYNPSPTAGDNFAITNPWKIAPTSHDQGKWYWMPGGGPDESPSSTRAPSPPPIPPHWKWMFENKFNEQPPIGGPDCCGNAGGEVYIRPSPSPDVLHGEHPYSYDPVDGGKFGQPPPKPFNSHHNHHHSVFSGNGGGDIGSVLSTQVTETEFDHIVKGSLEGYGGTEMKEKKKSKGPSPWKKILHVLSAAIPIGLLISAFTPQYVYVDPNSTMSLGQQQIPQQQQPKHRPPFDSGNYETRYDQYNHHHHIHRALTEGEINGSASSAGLFVPSAETLANLFVEVNALFANNNNNNNKTDKEDQQSPSTEDHESDDDSNRRRGIYHSHQQSRHRQTSSNNNSNQNKTSIGSDNDTKSGVQQRPNETAASQCQLHDLCEISLLGAAPKSHVVHRMLWMLANELEERPGMNEGARRLFRSVREGDCSRVKCEPDELTEMENRKMK